MGMKERGNWERYSGSYSLESGEYWPFVVPTNMSRRLKNATPKGAVVVDWDIAKDTLRSELDPEVDLDDDDVLDDVLNANGWEVLSCTPSSPSEYVVSPPLRDFLGAHPPLTLYLFLSPSSSKYGLEKTIVQPMKQVVPRSSIRGFKDDYYHVDADVVLLAGEIHLRRKPVSITSQPRSLMHTFIINVNADLISPFCLQGSMRFTEDQARSRFASMVVLTQTTRASPRSR